MKYILKVENLENVPGYSPMLAMDNNGEFIMREYSNGQPDNEIWYWGEYYDLNSAILTLGQLGITYAGPSVISNELVGDKYVITFDNSVTKLGLEMESGTGKFYPIFIDLTSLGIGITCNITEIEIPNSVTSIGDEAFQGCSGLTSVTIPNSVTNIGNQAFAYCSGLTSIEIPNSVTSIGQGSFGYCNALTSITVPNSITSIGVYAFVNCSSLTSITIPNSITSIGESTFGYCSSLTSIEIPNGVTSIGYQAFRNCTGLTSVTISNSVDNIGDYAFAYCSNLTSITCEAAIPPSLGGSSVFNNTNIQHIYVPAESVGTYQAAPNWLNYANIIEAIQ